MKKILLILVVVILTLSVNMFNVSAFENDIVKIDIPENFSSYTENIVDGTTVMQWTDLQDNSNVSITMLKNQGVSYVDLSDGEISELHTNVIEQMKNDVSQALKEYSVGYEIIDSTCKNVTVNDVFNGVEVIFDSEYSYQDGSVIQAKNYMYMFSSKDNLITVAATVNDKDKFSLIDDMMSSFDFKEEIYVGSDEFNIDWYSVVKSAVIGGCIGGTVVLIGLLIKKKKAEK